MLIRAHAKVNLALHVTAKRKDGFHEVDTLMARIALADEIWLETQKKDVILKMVNSNLPSDSSNLAHKAAEMYLYSAGIQQGVHITLKKNIPIAAGLGGGSSDAAAVLRGLKKLYPTEADILPIAKGLGADVPFFTQNYTAARARGKGEKLETVYLPKIHLVLVNPLVAVSAREAYEHLQSFSPPLDLSSTLEGLVNMNARLFNALQAGVIKLYPETEGVLEVLQKGNFSSVLMSGSGSTCFGLTNNAEYAKSFAKNLKASKPKWWVCTSYVV